VRSLLRARGALSGHWILRASEDALALSATAVVLLACISRGLSVAQGERSENGGLPQYFVGFASSLVVLLALYVVVDAVPRTWVHPWWWPPAVTMAAVAALATFLHRRRVDFGNFTANFAAMASLVVPMLLVLACPAGFHEWPRSLIEYQTDPLAAYRTAAATFLSVSLPSFGACAWLAFRRRAVTTSEVLLGTLVISVWPWAA